MVLWELTQKRNPNTYLPDRGVGESRERVVGLLPITPCHKGMKKTCRDTSIVVKHKPNKTTDGQQDVDANIVV